MAELADAASEFAAVLTRVANGTFARDASFEVQLHAERPIAWVWPAGSEFGHEVPLQVVAPSGPVNLWIKATFQVRLDDSRDYLAVERSVLALCINAEGRPAIRIEYDRDQGHEPDDAESSHHRRSAAHVQIHGVSAELSWALAQVGQPPRALEKFHIPVGGRRFRPSFEDFIEFLCAERVLPQLHDGWRDVIADTRGDWLTGQLRAAVRSDQETAADQLRQMGWTVEPPSGQNP